MCVDRSATLASQATTGRADIFRTAFWFSSFKTKIGEYAQKMQTRLTSH